MRRLRWAPLLLLVVALWLVLAGDQPADAPAHPEIRDSEGRTVPAEAAHLVDLHEFSPDLILDIRYAREDNVFGRALYPVARALCARGTAVKLARAQQALAAQGFRLILWDSYRPESVQRQMWAMVPDTRFVADPNVGSKHSRAAAVDVSLADADGNPLLMPTDHDFFGPEASPSWPDHPPEVRRRAAILAEAMRGAGFFQGTTEWWHFVDNDYRQYPLLDVPLDVPVPAP